MLSLVASPYGVSVVVPCGVLCSHHGLEMMVVDHSVVFSSLITKSEMLTVNPHTLHD